MICIEPGCGAETGSNRLKRCIPCREAHEAKTIKDARLRQSVKNASAQKANPRKCVNDDNPTEHSRVKYCAECRVKAAKERAESRSKKVAAARLATDARKKLLREAEDEILIKPAKPWKRKPKPAPIMTRAEQYQLDTELDRRLAERCGYRSSEVRTLSKEEIEALMPKLSPPIPRVWVGYCDRMMTEGWS